MIILGLNTSHNASACLLRDGEIVGCVSEERFTGIKNFFGYPKKSIDFLLTYHNISASDIDFVINAGKTSMAVWTIDTPKNNYVWKFIFFILNHMMLLSPVDWFLRQIYYLYVKIYSPRKIYKNVISSLKVKKNKILLASHHTCHAYAAFYGFSNDAKKSAVLTQDALGDFSCGTISVSTGKRIKKIFDIVAGNSIAAIYTNITSILGMKMYEHEYKVMGLAPYASSIEIKKVLPIFEKIIKINNFNIKINLGGVSSYIYLKRVLFGRRFDAIAGAMQLITEEKITQWVKNILIKTKVNRIVLGGGLFMNVKLNKIIGELNQIKSLIVCPSASDESNAIGAAYWGYEYYCKLNKIKFNPKPIENLYLGPAYSEREILSAFKSLKIDHKYKIKKINDIECKIAKLLSEEKIIARFSGRMEFGARALGNRSILANPSNPDVIKIINDQIKNRDFWMPFSPTILKEKANNYLVNPKNFESPFMGLAFDTTQLGRECLKAALHPYDFTARAQVLEEKVNQKYYKIIKNFEALTGISGVLNTSFNLHGNPIVNTPEDAIYTFENSGLEYLALENYLIQKGKNN